MPHALRIVWITLHHLCLSAGCLDLPCRAEKAAALTVSFLVIFAVAQDLEAVLALGQCPSAEPLRHDSPSSNALSGRIQVDDLQRACEDVVEAALGDTACQRHLAAFKADADTSAGAGLLTLVAAACGLAVAGAGASALALAFMEPSAGDSSFNFIFAPPYSFGDLEQIADLGDLAVGLSVVGLYVVVTDLTQAQGMAVAICFSSGR